MRHDLVLADDRFADAADDFVGIDAVALCALDLLNHDQPLRPCRRRQIANAAPPCRRSAGSQLCTVSSMSCG